jgi:hypothetical protein
VTLPVAVAVVGAGAGGSVGGAMVCSALVAELEADGCEDVDELEV